MRLPSVRAAVATAGLSAAMFGAARAPVRPNVLLVTIDTLRADRLGCYGYERARTPNVDALAAGGIRFADATAHSPLTFPAHASIFTGRYPGRYGIRLNGMTPLPAEAVTLAERFRAAGYRTGAVVASVILEEAWGLGQGFDEYLDEMSPVLDRSMALSELQRPADEVERLATAWLSSGGASPWFLWVHFYDPHLPYEAPARFQTLMPGRPYDAEVAAVDEALGRLLGRVDRSSTVVAVTSDHGEALGEHGELDHGFFVYDATLQVPLVLAGPGLRPAVVRDQVRSVDLSPTLVALAGVQPLDDIDGDSLVPLLSGERRRETPASYAESWYPRLHFGWSELRALRVGEWKYVAAPAPELYDLRVDPGEQRNVGPDRATVASRMAADLARIVRSFGTPSSVTDAPRQPDPETVARLRALGYVGTVAPAGTGAAGGDPKAHLAEYLRYREAFNRALGLIGSGRPAEAVALLKALVGANVRAFEVHLHLGHAYAALGRRDAALGEYEMAAQLNPEWAMPHFEAAKILVDEARVEPAIARARQGLAREPGSFYGLYTLGVVYQRAGLYRDAAQTFRQAVDANGRDPRARANLADASLRIGDLDTAAEQFGRLIDTGFQVAPSEYNLGLIALKRGDRAEAARRFGLALEADPKFQPARDALARLK